MDKRLRLIVLISSSYLLTKEDKESLLKKLKGMPESVVNTLGYILATEKKQSIESAKLLTPLIDRISYMLNAYLGITRERARQLYSQISQE